MRLAGSPQTAKEVADELHSIWFRHGDDVCAEQIEAHMESDGFTLDEIDVELDRFGLWHGRMYEIVIVPPG